MVIAAILPLAQTTIGGPVDSKLKARRTRTAWFAAAAGACLVLMVVVLVTSDYGSLGYGSINNAAVTWAMFGGVIFTTVALVGLARASTTPGTITSWRATGIIALVAWVSWVVFFIVQWAARDLGAVFAWLGPAALFFVPTLVGFPVWTVIAAIRGHGSPERVVVPSWPRRSGHHAAALKQVSPLATAERIVVPVGLSGSGVPATASSSRAGRRVAFIAGAVAVTLVVLGAASVADQWLRAREMSELTTFIEQSEDVMGATSTASTAAERAVELGVIADELSGLSPLPWHSSIVKLRDAYLDHNDAWVELYSGLARAKDGSEMDAIAEASGVEISTTFRIAGRSAQAALPSLFVGDLKDRLDAVFAG